MIDERRMHTSTCSLLSCWLLVDSFTPWALEGWPICAFLDSSGEGDCRPAFEDMLGRCDYVGVGLAYRELVIKARYWLLKEK